MQTLTSRGSKHSLSKIKSTRTVVVTLCQSFQVARAYIRSPRGGILPITTINLSRKFWMPGARFSRMLVHSAKEIRQVEIHSTSLLAKWAVLTFLAASLCSNNWLHSIVTMFLTTWAYSGTAILIQSWLAIRRDMAIGLCFSTLHTDLARSAN